MDAHAYKEMYRAARIARRWSQRSAFLRRWWPNWEQYLGADLLLQIRRTQGMR